MSNLNLLYRFGKRYLFSLSTIPYLFTVGLHSGKNRDLINTIARHFGYESNKRALPEIKVDAVLAPNMPVTLLELSHKNGNVAPLELIVLANLVKSSGAQAVFEFGTFDGRTTLNLAASSQPDTVVYTLDLPKGAMADAKLSLQPSDKDFIDKDRSGARYQGNPLAKKIRQLYGDSATFDFEPFRNAIDFVFVDASHSYEYVLRDSQTALSLIRKSGGMILWHDYGVWDGVTRALDELKTTQPAYSGLSVIEDTALAYLRLGN